MQQLFDFVRVRRMAKHRQPERRLGHKDIAGLRLERRAGRVGPSLVIARHDDTLAAIVDDHLRAAQHMPGRFESHRHVADRDRLAITRRLQRTAGGVAITLPHDRDGFAGGQHSLVAGTRVIAMPMRHDCPRHRPHRIDIKIAGVAIEAGGCWAQPGARSAVFIGVSAAGRGCRSGRSFCGRTSRNPEVRRSGATP